MNRKQRRAQGRGVAAPPEPAAPDPRPLFEAALGHHQAGRLAEAEALYRRILAADPGHADALHLLGVISHQAGRNAMAAQLIGQAVALNPSAAAYRSNLGIALVELGRLEEGVAAYQEAIRLKPDYVEAYANLGNALIKLGRPEQALAACAAAVRLDPNSAVAHCNLGVALQDLGRLDEAAAAQEAAIRLRPDYVEAHANLGDVRKRQGRLEEAVVACQTAIRLNPAYAQAYGNLAAAVTELGRPEEAVAACQAAIRLKPDYVEAYGNLGAALKELGRLDDAIVACQAAIRLKPDDAGAHYNLAFAHFLRGELEIGWPQYEWRWRTSLRAFRPRDFGRPRWRGEDIAGRTILLHAEQGIGDSIQFCRYAALVAARGAQVVLEAPRHVLRLLAGLPGVDRLVAAGDPLPTFDVHCPLMSLPGVFGTTVETVPADVPYLRAEDDVVRRWRERIGSDGCRIGVVWQGNPGAAAELGRSAPLAAFAPLAAVPGVRLISLQKAHGLDQLDRLPPGMTVETLGPDFDDGPDAFVDTAAAIMSLDLVVTVDTAVAHLAGAMGRPVWLALQKVPHWVWTMDGPGSPWYPAHRLFRQTERGDWNGVFRAMAAALAPAS